MDLDVGKLGADAEEAGGALSGLLGILGRLPEVAIQAATGYDAAAGRFRNASGQSVASGAFQGAMTRIGTGAKAVAGVISSLGATVQSFASGPLPSATQAMSKVGEVLGGAMTSGAHKAAEALGALGPEGQAAGAALEGLAAIGAATVGTLTSLMGTAIDVTERMGLLRASLEGLAGGSAAGAAAGKQIDALAASLPFAKQQTEAWAASLLGVGEAGDTLAAHVRAIAAAQALTAVTGGQGGAAAQSMFTKLAMGGKATETFMKAVHEGGKAATKILSEMGLNIKDLGGEAAVAKMNAAQFGDAVTKALQKRGGGALEEMGSSWTSIATKAREGFLSLFDALGPAVKPFMAAVKSLFGEFSKGGPILNAIKPVVTTVFSTLFSWATKAVTMIHKGFLYVAIGAVMAYIALQPVIAAIKKFASSANFILGLKVLLAVLLAPLVLLAVAFGVIAAVCFVVQAAFVAVVAGIVWLVGAIADFVSGAASALVEWASGAASAASDFVSGLVQGILSGAGEFVAAVTSLAQQGMAAFTSFFGIRSPSTKMLKHGEDNIAGAATTGVEKGSDGFQDAMAGLGDEPTGGAKGGRGAGKGSRGKLADVINFNYSGPASEAPAFFEQAQAWLEQLDSEGAVPAGAALGTS